jgi:hypothetical protein
MGIGSPSYANEWHLGIGTGFTFLNVQGDLGVVTRDFGTVKAEVDLSPSDVSDYMQTGLGLAGYATDGTWMIQYAFGMLKLGGEPSGNLPASAGGGTYSSDLFFKVLNGRFTVGRTIYRSKDMKFSFTPYTGVRFIKHELNADFVFTQGSTVTPVDRGVDHSWADVLIGAGIGYALSPKVNWVAGGDAGFGGSNGTFAFATSLSYKVAKHWSLGPNFTFTAVDYENGEVGDADWYLYDASEFGAGIGLMYHF